MIKANDSFIIIIMELNLQLGEALRQRRQEQIARLSEQMDRQHTERLNQ